MKIMQVKILVFVGATALFTFPIVGMKKTSTISNPFLGGTIHQQVKDDITYLTNQLNDIDSLETTEAKIDAIRSIVNEIYTLRPNVDGTPIKNTFIYALISVKGALSGSGSIQWLKEAFSGARIKSHIALFKNEYSSVSKARIDFKKSCMMGKQPMEACAVAELLYQTLMKLNAILGSI